MKRLVAGLLLLLPIAASAQDTAINPTVIAQPKTIVLQNTDVYYAPFAPDTSDPAYVLSNLADKLTDSNGIFSRNPIYRPAPQDSSLSIWKPHGTEVGGFTTWQRLFTARDQHNSMHSHSDIIAGSHVTNDTGASHGYGDVVISKNEDVDFRASGTIRLEDGFRAEGGCYFHAYCEPTWGSQVFGDDFDSSALDKQRWRVVNGNSDGYGNAECSFDTNVIMDTDYQAIDGHVLDIMMREDTDTCTCQALSFGWSNPCSDVLPAVHPPPMKAFFSSAIVRACPWPFLNRDTLPFQMAYQHAPYGKYEVREKIPHFLHHTNNWIAGTYEIDISEGTRGWPGMEGLTPSLHHGIRYGPFHGSFQPDSSFISTDANWSLVNNPNSIIFNNFAYKVKFADGKTHDTIIADDEPRACPVHCYTLPHRSNFIILE